MLFHGRPPFILPASLIIILFSAVNSCSKRRHLVKRENDLLEVVPDYSKTWMTTVYNSATKAGNAVTTQNCYTIAKTKRQTNPGWQADIGKNREIFKIDVFLSNSKNAEQFGEAYAFATEDKLYLNIDIDVSKSCSYFKGPATRSQMVEFSCRKLGKYISIVLKKESAILEMCHIRIYRIERDYAPKWIPWTDWSQCSNSCDGGKSTRTRKCLSDGKESTQCQGKGSENKACNPEPCPVDGGWSMWGPWTNCNPTCGLGSRSKTRLCNNPTPQFGGKKCEDKEIETEQCRETECAINGVWSAWTSWSVCSHTCGNSFKIRHRECDSPSPKFGGHDCDGEKNDTERCELTECPYWQTWTKFTACSVTCGGGYRNRSRSCETFGHSTGCQGNSDENLECNVQPCTEKEIQKMTEASKMWITYTVIASIIGALILGIGIALLVIYIKKKKDIGLSVVMSD